MGVKNVWLEAGEVGFRLQHSSQISSEAGAVVENVLLLPALPFSLFPILVDLRTALQNNKKALLILAITAFLVHFSIWPQDQLC